MGGPLASSSYWWREIRLCCHCPPVSFLSFWIFVFIRLVWLVYWKGGFHIFSLLSRTFFCQKFAVLFCLFVGFGSKGRQGATIIVGRELFLHPCLRYSGHTTCQSVPVAHWTLDTHSERIAFRGRGPIHESGFVPLVKLRQPCISIHGHLKRTRWMWTSSPFPLCNWQVRKLRVRQVNVCALQSENCGEYISCKKRQRTWIAQEEKLWKRRECLELDSCHAVPRAFVRKCLSNWYNVWHWRNLLLFFADCDAFSTCCLTQGK